jgi:murein DD-endopeptidase MepM/ murein hydrolase activator NlpD
MKASALLIFTFLVAATIAGAVFLYPSHAVAPASAEVRGDVLPESAVKGESVSAPFVFPMDRALERVTKKPFGLHIEPGHSPVPNDRFSGYHVGVDFETFENEQEIDIPVYAICEGPLLLKQFAKGYGGMMVQECILNGETVSIVYGHLHLETIVVTTGETIAQGQIVGFLGKGYSEETDGVRKHLHLGLYTETPLDIRGYVKEEEETKKWLNSLDYMPQ